MQRKILKTRTIFIKYRTRILSQLGAFTLYSCRQFLPTPYFVHRIDATILVFREGPLVILFCKLYVVNRSAFSAVQGLGVPGKFGQLLNLTSKTGLSGGRLAIRHRCTFVLRGIY